MFDTVPNSYSFMRFFLFILQTKNSEQQECIPVGCVPAAQWPYAGICFRGGGVCSRRGSALGGGCLLPGGVCYQGVLLLGGVCSEGGVSALGGVCSQGGVGGCGIPACTQAAPPVNRMTDRCKNITLATTSLTNGRSHRAINRKVSNDSFLQQHSLCFVTTHSACHNNGN